jgi:hypothetical protein
MMKLILISIAVIEFTFLCFIGGRFYEIYRDVNAANVCFAQISNDTDSSNYFKHKIETQHSYPHAEAYSYMRFYSCMNWEKGH